MTRLLYFTDVHYTESTPQRRKPGYGAQILKKLDWINRLGVKLEVDAYLCGGDWFHNKKVSMTELNNIAQVLRRMTYNIDHQAPVIGIIGNHDVPGHQEEGQHRRAIGVLYKSGLLIHPTYKVGDVVVHGKSYVPNYELEAFDPTSDYWKGRAGPGRIWMTHGTLVQEKLPFDISQALAKDAAPPPGVLLINGHMHHGWQQPENGIWNCGSVCRCSIENQKSNLEPRVLVLQWDGKDWKVKPVPIPVEDDVWTTEDHMADRATPEEIESFVAKLEEEEVAEELQGKEGLEELLKDKPDPVRNKVYDLLEMQT